MKQPTIYVLCPENNRPSGGIKILYRHVDVLNRNGFTAAILHQQNGFRCTWFTNETRVVYLPDVQLRDEDFLLIPEIFGPNMLALSGLPQIGPKVRKVIFNQNCYYTFLGRSIDSVLQPDFTTPYTRRDEFVAAIVVSDDSARYLGYAFPGLRIFRIHNAIDTQLFAPGAAKKPQICFMPRKHPEDALQVLAILKSRGALDGFAVVPIDNKREREVADVLRESLIFLSFGYPEGCPLPPAEAMSCGCIVIGYHGLGGAEYFKEEFCRPVPINDIVGFADAIESVIGEWRHQPDRIRHMSESAAAYIRSTYSARREQEDIVACWQALLGSAS